MQQHSEMATNSNAPKPISARAWEQFSRTAARELQQ